MYEHRIVDAMCVGLVSRRCRPELNWSSSVGTVLRFVAAKERYKAQMKSSQALLNLKPQNIVLDDETALTHGYMYGCT